MNTFSTPSKLKTMRKLPKTYNLIEFLRPSSFWPHPYTIEDAYLLLTHIARQASHLQEQHRWGVATIWDTISSGSGYSDHALKLTNSTAIREAWTRLLLARATDTIEKWKSENNIGSTATITAATYRHKPFAPALRWTCESEIAEAFKKFFNHYLTKNTTVSLNSIHPAAVEILQTSIIITNTSTIFQMTYCIRASYGGYSSWHQTLSTVRDKESILHGLERALDTLDLLTKESPDDGTVLTLTDRLNEHAHYCVKNSAYRLTDNNQPVISPFRPTSPYQTLTA